MVLGRNDPELGAERSRNWGGTTAFGADVERIDPGRIDSGADRPVPPENCRSSLHQVYVCSLLFPSPTYNYFRFASAILNLQVQEVYDMADVGTTEKIANENHWNLVSRSHRT